MSDLPSDRVVPSERAFLKTGIDYAGSFQIFGRGGRHKVFVKARIALFVCFLFFHQSSPSRVCFRFDH